MRRPICTIPQHSAQVLRKPRVLPCLTDPSSLHCDPVKLVLGYILLFLRGPLQNVSRMLMSPALRKFDISNSQSENFMRSVQLKLSGIISLLSVNFTYPLVFPPLGCGLCCLWTQSSLVQVAPYLVDSCRQHLDAGFECGRLAYRCGHLLFSCFEQVRSRRRSATMRDGYEKNCFWSQTEMVNST